MSGMLGGLMGGGGGGNMTQQGMAMLQGPGPNGSTPNDPLGGPASPGMPAQPAIQQPRLAQPLLMDFFHPGGQPVPTADAVNAPQMGRSLAAQATAHGATAPSPVAPQTMQASSQPNDDPFKSGRFAGGGWGAAVGNEAAGAASGIGWLGDKLGAGWLSNIGSDAYNAVTSQSVMGRTGGDGDRGTQFLQDSGFFNPLK